MTMTRAAVLAALHEAATAQEPWRWSERRPQLRRSPAPGVTAAIALHLTLRGGAAEAAPVLDLQASRIARAHKAVLGRAPAAGVLRYPLSAGPVNDPRVWLAALQAEAEAQMAGLDMTSQDGFICSLPDTFRAGTIPRQDPMGHIIARLLRGERNAVEQYGFNPTVTTAMLDAQAADLDALKAARDVIPGL